ncbi:hypothetical protein H6A60_11915 [Sutterella massiliensis]|uniref:DUF4258 domain-containing protein n=1 Tax=Sutterella massiliensis TaxID=1816689 RepID=A0ABS2DUY8_9BURK|nr:hypothetical protein [Sutterella massiliensis]MBM6705171.1 hypothetical protein [Sutterella massiliensis]
MSRTTQHFAKRLSQRGIRTRAVDVVRRFGCKEGDRVILNAQACRIASEALAKLKRDIDEIGQRGGYVAVEADDALITAYRLNSFRF